jgi:hypothetical protein
MLRLKTASPFKRELKVTFLFLNTDRTGNVQKYPGEQLECKVTSPRLSSFSKAHTSLQHRDVENGDANGTAEFL